MCRRRRVGRSVRLAQGSAVPSKDAHLSEQEVGESVATNDFHRFKLTANPEVGHTDDTRAERGDVDEVPIPGTI
jgi:hypothetical protein